MAEKEDSPIEELHEEVRRIMTHKVQDISVIICAYTEDRWNDLTEAIESVKQQTLAPREIIIVIDHNPALLKRVREQVSGVVVVENTEARGLSGARNSGIAVAQGQIIAFLDDDAIAMPDWLIQLSTFFTDPNMLGAGGSIHPLWIDKKPFWLPEEFYWVIGCTFRGMPQTVAAVRNLIGANMSLRRVVFDTVGGFCNEVGRVGTWPISAEENELCIRAHQLLPQSVFIYQPQAMVFHRVPNQRTRWHYFCVRCYAEGLSKAIVARYVGVKSGLTTELVYTLFVLPKGIVRGLADTLFHHDLTGLARAGAIMVGLAVTTAGYIMGSTRFRSVRSRSMMAREAILPPAPQ